MIVGPRVDMSGLRACWFLYGVHRGRIAKGIEMRRKRWRRKGY